jgi:hypothetical protein
LIRIKASETRAAAHAGTIASRLIVAAFLVTLERSNTDSTGKDFLQLAQLSLSLSTIAIEAEFPAYRSGCTRTSSSPE